jgi:glutamine amidotransferase
VIKILDYGMGNCGSIKNMLRYLGTDAEIVNQPAGLADASAIILPGVGSFDHGMTHLKPFTESLEKRVLIDKVPFLGVCLGMQLLLEKSDEGELGGLGWIDGEVKRFSFSKSTTRERLVVPHMGWNEVWSVNESRLVGSSNIENRDRFYFVHSFHATAVPEGNVIARCCYGYDFVCGIRKKNIYGVQFHPEKSHKFGKKMFNQFIELSQC